MATRTNEKKKYQSRHRFLWATRFPLKPGRDIMSRRGLLALIAQTAVSGQFWQAIKTREPNRPGLSERAGLHESSVRALLVKLCAEGALRGQARGYKRTTVYTLMRLDEVVEHGDFLPAEEVQKRFPRTGADRLSTSAYIGAGLEPDQPGRNGLDRLSTSAQADLTACLPAPKKIIREEDNKTYSKTIVLPVATANGAPRLPSAPDKTLSSFSSIREEEKAPDGRHCADIPQVTLDLNDYLTSSTGRPLDGPWCRYADLEHEMDRRDFWEVGDILGGILSRTGGALPEPRKFFGAYGQYHQVHLARERSRKDGRRRAA